MQELVAIGTKLSLAGDGSVRDCASRTEGRIGEVGPEDIRTKRGSVCWLEAGLRRKQKKRFLAKKGTPVGVGVVVAVPWQRGYYYLVTWYLHTLRYRSRA